MIWKAGWKGTRKKRYNNNNNDDDDDDDVMISAFVSVTYTCKRTYNAGDERLKVAFTL